MRRLPLLLAAGALWLFLAAIPALADGGPHIAVVNSGSSTLTADSCAGCHRAHTAQGEYLLKAANETALCLTCHGNGGTLATTDVEWGVQWVPTGSGGRSGTELGALRDGGFLKARIDSGDPARIMYKRAYSDAPYNTTFELSPRAHVGALDTSLPVTSAHVDVFGLLATPVAGNGIADKGTIWGKGVVSGAANYGTPDVELECVDCHNPHGNGQYRILRPVQGTETDPIGQPIPVTIKATFANFDTVVTDTQNGFVVGDKLTIGAGSSLTAGDYYVAVVTNGFTFKVAASSTTLGTVIDITSDSAGPALATAKRSQVAVADVNPDPDGNQSYPTKNYTILETKGVQGTNDTFLLYARDVVNARTANALGVDEAGPAVTITDVVSFGTPAANYFKTSGSSKIAVGDRVTIAGSPGGISAGTYFVRSISSSGTDYDLFRLYTTAGGSVSPIVAAGIVGASVARNGLTGDYSATGGDYFRRTVPWNPVLNNSFCNTEYAASGSALAAACATMNDAPNGRPNAITSGAGVPTNLAGQQAFIDQISTWCSQCHTRYYQNTNENQTGLANVSDALAYINTYDTSPDATTPANRIQSYSYSTGGTMSLPGYGDQVTFANFGGGNAGLNGGTFWVIATGGSGSSAWIQVSTSKGGTAQTLVAFTNSDAGVVNDTGAKIVRMPAGQSSNSGWGYPRAKAGTIDAVFAYQHSTASNRACTTCHVSHGSNATMTGQNGTQFALNVPYPDDSIALGGNTSSRLLKINNRGTCQMCHDPTGTTTAGQANGDAYLLTHVP